MSMTAFSTHFYAKTERIKWSLLGTVLLFLTLVCKNVAADSAQIRQAELVATTEAYVLNADLDIHLGETLTEALMRGVSLHFVLEFEVKRKRWYWLDEHISSVSIHYRVSYNTITRAYRLSIGNLHLTYDSLDSVLRDMSQVRNWPVVELDELEPGEDYEAGLRFRHDMGRLPRPFQIEALRDRSWNLDTDWLRWSMAVGSES